MKNIWMLLLICGINISVFGQVISDCSIILNNDTSPFISTLENKNLIHEFKTTDVLTITFNELKTDMSKKSVEITSNSKSKGFVIGTFDKTDIDGDESYVLNISFDNLQDKLNSGADNIYDIIIQDEVGQQSLLKFRLAAEPR